MVMKNTSPDGGAVYVNVQRLEQGGTGGTTAQQALQNLNGVTPGQLGQPNGPVLLDATGTLYPEYLEGLSLTDIAVDGDVDIFVGESKDFFLTTYDSFTEYEISAVAGKVTQTENVIRYTAGNIPGIGGFFINGRQIFVNIIERTIERPIVLSPVSGSADTPNTLIVQLSAFETSGGFDSHLSSDWEVATDLDFTNVILSLRDDMVNLTSLELSALASSTLYYVRARYRGTNFGLSEWSVPVFFTTGSAGFAGNEIQKLLASDGVSYDDFGISVAITQDGLTLVVGAKSGNGNKGAVYVFVRNGETWIEQAKLVAGDGYSGQAFGGALSISSDGQTVLVGASSDSQARGAAYIFTQTDGAWAQKAKLVASDAASNNRFGLKLSLSADGQTALIGAFGNSTGRGAAYVFVRSGDSWAQQAKLTASDTVAYQLFGYAVSISGDGQTALISATSDSGGRGAVYAFSRNGSTWTQKKKFVAAGAQSGDRFAECLYLLPDGQTVLIGSPGYNFNLGAAYVFVRNGDDWTEQALLEASEEGYQDEFGASVTFSPDGLTALIGAPYRDNYRGAAYVFTLVNGVWTEQLRLVASDGGEWQEFGKSASLTANASVAVVGANYGTPTEQGSAYVFK